MTIFVVNSIFGQSLVGVNPSNAEQGQILSLEFTGTNTLFTQGTSTTFWLSQGTSTVINPDNCSIINDSIVNCNFTFTGHHNIGLYDANVNSLNTLVLQNGFTLNSFSNPPSLSDILPDSALLGDTLMMILSGINTQFGQGTSTVPVWFTQGTSTLFYPNSTTITDDYTIDYNLIVPSNIDTGWVDTYVNSFMDGFLNLANALNIYGGEIGGQITQGPNKTDDTPLANVDVYLLDIDNNILLTSTTDLDGMFLFSKLAKGTYKISVDVVDLDTTNLPTYTISGSNYNFNEEWLSLNGQDLEVASGIYHGASSSFASYVFPNPASKSFNLFYDNVTNQNKKILVVKDVSGRKVSTQTTTMQLGINTVVLNLEQPTGIYFLEVWGNNKLEHSFKIVKQ